MDRRVGMNGSLVMDRRLKWVIGCGCGWVVAEVAPVMTFFEWVCSGGFQIGSGDDFFLIGVGLCLFVSVSVSVFVVCGLC